MADEKKRKRRGERDDGRILVTLVVGRDDNGKIIRKYFYGRSRKEAEKKRDEYKRMQEMGLSADADDMTLNDWIDEWLRRYKQDVNPNYVNNFMVQVNRLRAALGGRLIRSIREADLQGALYALKGMSSSSIDKYHTVIRQVFMRAKRNKIIPDDPAEDLTVPEGTVGTHRALEKWESEVILLHWSEHRSGLWAMLMLLCGLRRGEMIALDWSNVDMENRQIRVCEAAVVQTNQTQVVDRTKTTAGMRVLPICWQLYAALDSVPVADRVGRVCVSAKGEQLSESAFSRGWNGFNLAMTRILNGEPVLQPGRRTDLEKKRISDEIAAGTRKVFDVRAHDLRHTFATALYDAGVSVKAAQYYLGHADIRMTLELYTHLSKERENAERSQLVGFLDGWAVGKEIGLEDRSSKP